MLHADQFFSIDVSHENPKCSFSCIFFIPWSYLINIYQHSLSSMLSFSKVTNCTYTCTTVKDTINEYSFFWLTTCNTCTYFKNLFSLIFRFWRLHWLGHLRSYYVCGPTGGRTSGRTLCFDCCGYSSALRYVTMYIYAQSEKKITLIYIRLQYRCICIF